MTALLPPNLLRLFAPRPPLPYLKPVDKGPKQRKPIHYSGVGEFWQSLRIGDDDDAYEPTETAQEKKDRMLKEKKEKMEELKITMEQSWDPTAILSPTADPYKTLFVSNLAFDTTEKQLKKSFEAYGDVKDIKLVVNKKDQMKGYAFIEFDRESGLKVAYKEAAGLKLAGRRLIVDVERGRTVKGWKPKKLGGGLGKQRSGQPQRPRSGVMPRGLPFGGPPSSYGGGGRGGGRGGRDFDRGGDRGGDRGDRGGDRGDRGDRGGDRDRYDGERRGGGIGYRPRGESNGYRGGGGGGERGGYDRDRGGGDRDRRDRDGGGRYDDRRRGGSDRRDDRERRY